MNQKTTLIIIFFTISTLLTAQNASELNRKGIELGKKKNYLQAINNFNKSITAYNKKSAKVFHNKGWALELQGNFKEAIKNYELALKRNPQQIISAEKLGFLLYKNKEYHKAVIVGEHILKIDKNNKNVLKWLQDAYIQKLKNREKHLAKLKKQKELEKKKKEKDLYKKEKEAKDNQVIYASLEAMIKTGLYHQGGYSYKYIEDTGFVFNLVENLYIHFTPIKFWGIDLILSNPHLGALLPTDVLYHQERLETFFRLGNFTLGVGFMLSHHISSNNSFAMNLQLLDWKVGIIIGYKEGKTEMTFRAYPKIIPMPKNNQSFEYSLFELNYLYQISRTLAFYTTLFVHDFYLYNHVTPASDYWGVFGYTLGVRLGKLNRLSNKFHIAFSVELTQRMYLNDMNNTNPYSIVPNGQGWFGLNISQWISGDPFSGYDSTGVELAFRVDEQFNKNFFLYQKIIIEIGDFSKDHHELNFVIGLGIAY